MTPNPGEFTDAQLLQMVRQDAERQGAQPPPLPGMPGQVAAPPTITIGSQVFPANDVQAIQAAIAAQQAQFAAIQRQHQQVAPPAPAPPPVPAAPPAPAPFAGPTPRWGLKEYADELEKDPTRATDAALGQAMGLPNGMTASQLIGVLGGRLMQTEQALTKLTKDQEEYSTRLATSQAQIEAERFSAQHQEYIPDPSNFEILERHRTANGLNADAKGWHLSFLAAREAGEPLKLKQQPGQPGFQPPTPQYQQQPQFQPQYPQYQQPQAPLTPGLPSLRQTGTETSPSALPHMLAYLDSLPADKWGPAVSNFESQLGKVRR